MTLKELALEVAKNDDKPSPDPCQCTYGPTEFVSPTVPRLPGHKLPMGPIYLPLPGCARGRKVDSHLGAIED